MPKRLTSDRILVFKPSISESLKVDGSYIVEKGSQEFDYWDKWLTDFQSKLK